MKPVSSGSKLYEQVVERISAMITQGVYQKGDLLPSEKELIEMMGVSRITVREALRLLSESGVIQTRKGKGSYLMVDAVQLTESRLRSSGYREHFFASTDVRILLEPEVARMVAERASQADIELIGIHLANGDLQVLESFHHAIFEAAHNPLLMDVFDQLVAYEAMPSLDVIVPPARQKNVSAKLRSHHEKIFKAIRERNAEFAYFYMKEHMEYVRRTYEEYFEVFAD